MKKIIITIMAVLGGLSTLQAQTKKEVDKKVLRTDTIQVDYKTRYIWGGDRIDKD